MSYSNGYGGFTSSNSLHYATSAQAQHASNVHQHNQRMSEQRLAASAAAGYSYSFLSPSYSPQSYSSSSPSSSTHQYKPFIDHDLDRRVEQQRRDQSVRDQFQAGRDNQAKYQSRLERLHYWYLQRKSMSSGWSIWYNIKRDISLFFNSKQKCSTCPNPSFPSSHRVWIDKDYTLDIIDGFKVFEIPRYEDVKKWDEINEFFEKNPSQKPVESNCINLFKSFWTD